MKLKAQRPERSNCKGQTAKWQQDGKTVLSPTPKDVVSATLQGQVVAFP